MGEHLPTNLQTVINVYLFKAFEFGDDLGHSSS